MFYPYLGILWVVLGCVLLYRAYSKTRQTGIQTLADSETVLLSKKQRMWNLILGWSFLALSFAYFILGLH